jgi:hypothetical protein
MLGSLVAKFTMTPQMLLHLVVKTFVPQIVGAMLTFYVQVGKLRTGF